MPTKHTFSYVVPGTPEAVAAQIKKDTQNVMSPVFGRAFPEKNKSLAGRVASDRFRLSLNDRAFTFRAVATGTLTAAPGGTRVDGHASLPQWLAWLMRVSLGFLVAGLIGGTVTFLSSGSLPLALAYLGFWVPFFLLFAISAGHAVHRTNNEVPQIIAQLQDVTAAGVSATETTPNQTPVTQPTRQTT